ncbi:uncharacterized protein LOC121788263 [Salvia splendens]|uniref:uncharacterized protein LOC121788263 n=1 Tax=Salvia splendens TaxID=180675 RepID=UPI001C2793FD|nr:uncharacterized protein LOC121788263 [Salvia splendens]
MEDDENNIFSDSQNFNPSQDFNPSQNVNPSQDYFPSFDDFSNSEQFQSSFQNQHSSQTISQTKSVVNTPHGWSEQEDMTLMSAWCFVSTNAVVGTNQTSNHLWQNVLFLYKQTRKENPGIGEERSLESLKQRYKLLNANVSKWVFEEVMRLNPKWELKLNSTGSTRFRPDEDSLEESRGSSKRDQAKDRAKRKGEEVATPSYTIPNDFTASLREMRVTRERECDIQERKIKAASDIQERNIKAAILTPLMARRDLTPKEEDLKRNLIAELFGK